MRKELRELLGEVAPLGWTLDGFTGAGHVRLRHRSGAEYVTASTPSDVRGRRNTLSDLRRVVRERR